MHISAEGQLVLSLHQRAERSHHIVEKFALADLILTTIATGRTVANRRRPTGALVGIELHTGRIVSADAREIRQASLMRLRDYSTMLEMVDEIGYTPQVLRAAVTLHYNKLTCEELGTDGHCVLMDIECGLKQVSPKVKEVIELLAAGYGPQQVGERLNANGSRLVALAFVLLSKALDGGQNGSKTK